MAIIHIYGASGSGTSTLGRAIKNKYGYTHLDTDDYFWLPTNPPFVQKRPIEERLELLHRDIKTAERVVISGSLCGWGDALIPSFDLVARLDVPKELRVERLLKREYERFGERVCAGGDMYGDHLKFIQWAEEYDDGDIFMRSKAMHNEWAKRISCKHIVLDGTLSSDHLIQEINRIFTL